MEYIPDKNLYSAVMFALSMCPSLQSARDDKINIAANYYRVNRADVLKIVSKELWSRAIKEAAKDDSQWYTIFNYHAPALLNVGIGRNYVLICPRCGKYFAANVDSVELDRLFVSQCPCGFVDEGQRNVTRKEYFEYLSSKKSTQ